jgi:endonuclease/exonuclease/phosphatase (EEP) superfamily protein YafD
MQNSPAPTGCGTRLLLTLIAGYTLGLLAFALLRVLVGDQWWWLALLYNGAPYPYLLVIVLLPVTLWWRARRLAGWLSVAGVVALVWFAPLWLPRSVPTVTGTPLRVVTMNLFPQNPRLADVEAWLLTTDADVILLQETDGTTLTTTMPALAAAYPQQVLQAYRNGGAVFSRYPIQADSEFSLGGNLQQRVTLSIGETAVTFYNVHLQMPLADAPRFPFPLELLWRYDESLRNTQLRQLLDTTASNRQAGTRYIVAGDFNMSEFAPIYRELAAVMTDAFRTTSLGVGATFPAGASEEIPDVLPPLVRLDYVWYGAKLQAVSSQVGPRLGSDHAPLWVDLVILP